MKYPSSVLKSLLIAFWFTLTANFNAQNTILWEVSHPEKEKRSYLLGTYHQLGNSFVDSIPIIKELLYASEIAFFESVDPVDSLVAMMNKRTEQFEYKKILSRSELKFLESHTEKWSVPVSKLTPIKLIIKLRQDYILYTCATAQQEDKWDHFDNYLSTLHRKTGTPSKDLRRTKSSLKTLTQQPRIIRGIEQNLI